MQADRQGDFGYGWRLEYRNTDLRVGLPKSGLEDIGIYSALRPGVKVFLNVPGEGRQGFTFNPDIRVLPGFGGNNLVLARPRFTPDPGVTSTLSTGTSSYLQVNEQGELFAPGGIPYNPASPDFGGAYVLTTREGITYRIDGTSGKLTSATDRNGNTIRFTKAGIEAEGLNVGIAIQRDRAGRITQIVDQNGNAIAYNYQAGRLDSVTDREGNTTEFTYLADQNYLDSVIDPLGREGQRLEYNEDGRLTRSIDVAGNSYDLTYDLGSSVVRQVDRLGNESIVVYDGFGNITEVIDALGNSVRAAYDPAGNLVRETDPLGNTRSYAYDRFGNIVRATDELGHSQTFEYSARNQPIVSTDSIGNRTEHQYDEKGNRLRTSVNGTIVETQSFDDRGRVVAATDAHGNTTSFEYSGVAVTRVVAPDRTTYHFESDAAGSPLSEKAELSGPLTDAQSNWTYQLDRNGQVVGIGNGQGSNSSVTLDYAGKAESIVQADGLVQSFELDEFGRVIAGDYGNGNVVTTAYNAEGQPTQIQLADGTLITYEYDAAGRRTQKNASNGREVTRILDAAGNVIRLEHGDGTVETFEYNARGQLLRQSNDRGLELTYAYDALGNLLESSINGHLQSKLERDIESNQLTQTLADGSRVVQTLDESGRLLAVETEDGRSLQYRYGSSERPTQTVDELGQIWQYEYDSAGNLGRISRPDGQQILVGYDQHGRRVIRQLPGEFTETVSYDSRGNISEIERYDGTLEQRRYDDQNQLTSLAIEGQTLETWTYIDMLTQQVDSPYGRTSIEKDASRRTISWQDPHASFVSYSWGASEVTALSGGVERSYQWQDGRLTQVDEGRAFQLEYDALNLLDIEFHDGAEFQRSYDDAGLLSRLAYTDDNGNELYVIELEREAGGRIVSRRVNGVETRYEYDLQGRLISQTSESESIRFAYDGLGNRVRVDRNGSVEESQFDANDRLTSAAGRTVTYSENGYIESRGISGGSESFEYDYLGRLSRFTRAGANAVDVTYEYDVDGLLLTRTSGGESLSFIWDRYSGRLPMLAAVQNAAGETQVEIFYDSDNYVMQRNADGTEIRYVVDQQGSVLAGLDEDGTIVFRRNFDAFGYSANIDSYWLAFAGGLQDPESGLVFQRARWYSPQDGRFLQPDQADADVFLPQTINRYTYSLNDPVNRVDLDGYFSFSELSTSQKITLSLIGISGILGFADAPSLLARKFSNGKVTFKNPTGSFRAFGEVSAALVVGGTLGAELVDFDGKSGPNVFVYAGGTIGFEGTLGLSRSSQGKASAANAGVAVRPTAVGDVFEATEPGHYEGTFYTFSAGVRGSLSIGAGVQFGSVNAVAWSPDPIPNSAKNGKHPTYAHTRIEFTLGGALGGSSGVGLSAVSGFSSTYYVDWTGLFKIEENIRGAQIRRLNPGDEF